MRFLATWAAPEGVKEQRKEMQMRSDHIHKNIMYEVPKTCENPAWHVPRPSQMEAREVPGSQNPPQRTPRAFNKSPRAAQEAPKSAQEEHLGPTWRPKRVPNRGRKPKKAMLKNKPFLASIFEGFGRHFGRVFGGFFDTQKHTDREKLKCVQS